MGKATTPDSDKASACAVQSRTARSQKARVRQARPKTFLAAGDTEPVSWSQKHKEAFDMAQQAHFGVVRKATPGMEYIMHPLLVSKIVQASGADEETIIAALLHDVVEDSEVTLEEIRDKFGVRVARMVEAVTKDPTNVYMPLEQQADAVYQQLNAVGKNAFVIKGADLIANMSDLIGQGDDKGIIAFYDIFGEKRAKRKVAHYLKISTMIAAQLENSEYNQLSSQLKQRINQLTVFHNQLA